MAKRRSRPRRSPLARLLRRLLIGSVLVTLLIALAVGGIVYHELARSLPPLDAVVDYQPPVATQILAEDGTVIGEFFSEKRYQVPIDRIPSQVREAFLAAEDDAFYRHRGVDLSSIIRAFINNLLAGKKVQGGSTITQQVVKSLLLTPRKSYERKLKEIILSLRLEQQLSKDEILGLYLNHIYLGSGAYGVAAAAREYFGKDITDINLSEAAVLAGLPRAPSRYSPYRHWPSAKARQRYVLNRMYQSRFITREERDAALRRPIALASRRGSFLAAPYFVEHVRRIIEERSGHTALYELGLRVHTTLNLPMQQAAEAVLREGLETLADRHGAYRSSFRRLDAAQREIYLSHQARALHNQSLDPTRTYEGIVTSVRVGSARVQVGPLVGNLVGDPSANGDLPDLELNDFVLVRVMDTVEGTPQFMLDPGPAVEGALVALEPQTGYVKAMVGGYDFHRSEFNRVTQAKRQPGSAFKPLVYAAAFDRQFTPASIIVDSPISFDDHGRVWSPQNFKERHFGPTSLREALTFSRNVVTVKLANRIGVGYLVKYLLRFGLQGPLMRNLSISLGSAEVSPLELAVAYATLANGGTRPEPVVITEITDAQGQILERNAPKLVEAIPPTTAYLVTSILQDVVKRGTGRNVRGLGQPTAGKTGTTNDLHDAWFVGFTPRLLAAVWVGFDNKRPLGRLETGGRVAAPIWKAFMEEALKDLPPAEFPVPDGLKCVHIDPATGRRSLPGTAAQLECFRAGTEPRPGSVPAFQTVTDEDTTQPSSLDFLRDDF